MPKLIKKNAFSPSKGKFYYIKNGSIYETTPNRKGGKKGRKVCKPAKRKPTRKKALKKKKRNY